VEVFKFGSGATFVGTIGNGYLSLVRRLRCRFRFSDSRFFHACLPSERFVSFVLFGVFFLLFGYLNTRLTQAEGRGDAEADERQRAV